MRLIFKSTIFLMAIYTTSCNTSEVGLENANDRFSSEEIVELNKIVSSFDSILVKKYGCTSLAPAYLVFSDSTFSSLDHSLLLEFDLIYSIYDEIYEYQVAEKIWWKDPHDKDRINYSSNKPYMDYLFEQGLKNSFIHEYWENVNSVSDIGPSMVLFFSKNANKLNFNNRNHRLIFAIHYFTIYNR